jgi:arabinan endo-1,5-alpha-L-arabinosidase
MVTNKYECFQKCSSLPNCALVSTSSNQCKLYDKINFSNFFSSPGSSVLFQKYNEDYSSINAYLAYHWPFNGNGNEIISGKNIIAGTSYSFVTDRLNSPSSAVHINNGYMQMSSGFYINSDFTITTWINPQTYQMATLNRRLLQFSTSNGQDVVLVDIYVNINFAILNTGAQRTLSTPSQPCGKWYHLAVTLQGTTGTIYVNGKVKTQGLLYSVRNLIQTNAVFGSSSAALGLSDAKFDDIKIFNRSLTQTEIMKVMNSYY